VAGAQAQANWVVVVVVVNMCDSLFVARVSIEKKCAASPKPAWRATCLSDHDRPPLAVSPQLCVCSPLLSSMGSSLRPASLSGRKDVRGLHAKARLTQTPWAYYSSL